MKNRSGEHAQTAEPGQQRREVERREGEGTVEYLRRLESTGRYLFHGSPSEIEALEPRDPVTDATDNPENKRRAVYAYSSPALSIQRAIVDRSKAEGEWDIVGGTDPEKPDVPLLMTTANLPLGTGYVHVLPRGAFRHAGGYQWVSESPVAPVDTVEVGPETYQELGGAHRIIAEK